jgi:hypothetical protein
MTDDALTQDDCSEPVENNKVKSDQDATPELKSRPRPLKAHTPPSPTFPVEALGEDLEAVIRAAHNMVLAPVAISGQSLLAVITLAVQGHADVVLPCGGTRPISNFFVTIARSGERKSTADSKALSPIREREKELMAAYLFAKTHDPQGFHPAPALTFSDPTYEGVVQLLMIGEPSMGLFMGESGQFIAGPGFSGSNKLKFASGLSNLWDGDAVRRVRKSEGFIHLDGRRLSCHMLVQPAVSSKLLTDPLLKDQGLLSRMLITYPDSLIGTRDAKKPDPKDVVVLERYQEYLLKILRVTLPIARGGLDPRRLPLSDEAAELWFDFYHETERALGPGGELEPIGFLCNKLPEHAARLAAVRTMYDDLDAKEIPAGKMSDGIKLVQFYRAERIRMTLGSQVDQDLAAADKLLTWLQESWRDQLVSLPDVYGRGPYALRSKVRAASAVEVLVDYGWLVKEPGSKLVDGTTRREVWRINE